MCTPVSGHHHPPRAAITLHNQLATPLPIPHQCSIDFPWVFTHLSTYPPTHYSIQAWHSPHPSTNSIQTLSTHPLGLHALIHTSVCLPIGLPTHPPFDSNLSGSQIHICTPFLLSGPGAHPCHHVHPSIHQHCLDSNHPLLFGLHALIHSSTILPRLCALHL